MPKYKIEYTYLAFCGEDLEGYDFDVVEVKAISPTQAIKKAKQDAPFNAKKFNIINTIYE